MTQNKVIREGTTIPKSACIVTLIAMVVCGVLYKTVAQRLQKSVGTPIRLPVPLRALPFVIGDWTGRDVPLDESIVEAAANDDFCSRFYLNRNSNYGVTLYLAYSARPRTMLGHRPDVCYVGAGWILDSTEKSSFVATSGKKIPCLLHRFHRPQLSPEELVVLNFYILNGKVSAEESGFSGIQWRTPNIEGNIARYVAQVQISSVLENSVRDAATDMTDTIVGFFPDTNDVNKPSADTPRSVYEHKEGDVNL
ncbi:MAG: exosortase-associated EpsI family protein [Sedimentisphaerales bacterium]|nr:exosortase-associated EpsI family protein [Sedimentisphaerales bacterium]